MSYTVAELEITFNNKLSEQHEIWSEICKLDLIFIWFHRRKLVLVAITRIVYESCLYTHFCPDNMSNKLQYLVEGKSPTVISRSDTNYRA
jgi:hypothetical protein